MKTGLCTRLRKHGGIIGHLNRAFQKVSTRYAVSIRPDLARICGKCATSLTDITYLFTSLILLLTWWAALALELLCILIFKVSGTLAKQSNSFITGHTNKRKYHCG